MVAAYIIDTTFNVQKNEGRAGKVKTELHSYLKYSLSSLPHNVSRKTAFPWWVTYFHSLKAKGGLSIYIFINSATIKT